MHLKQSVWYRRGVAPVLVGSSGTVTNFPPCFTLNNGSRHFSHRALSAGTPALLGIVRERGFATGVLVAVTLVLCAYPPVAHALVFPDRAGGGLSDGGVDGTLDTAEVASEKSLARSGVDDTDDSYPSDRLCSDVLALDPRCGDHRVLVDIDIDIGGSGDGDAFVSGTRSCRSMRSSPSSDATSASPVR